ncbi:MAG: hypothetical protein J0J01_14230 [Reyranella sp.]|uniref:hypothetical protein n=1 Tax=Reyranella sp. TaxID=1929291 RepID=UPI001ACBF7A8|nr:hypothetical protein [Reyranella sp.]MBN9088063.1 hypothetical protein [Reyranella sp.]
MLNDQEISGFGRGAPPARLEHLQQQERVWFAWVCRLHDVHSGSDSPHSAAVLAIARRRWAEARRALQREAQQRFAERPGRSPAP